MSEITPAETRGADIGWRSFTIRLIEAVRWPAAFVIVVYLLREPIGRFVDAITHGISS